jgi:hypothetical protein
MFSARKKVIKFHPKHQTHHETLLRFVALIAILLGYFFFLSWEYGASTGFSLALLTWSFFVLCTPIADGGFIIAFPVRLLFGIKMAVTQVVVWGFAIAVNVYMLVTKSLAYELTFLTKLLKHILVTPYPYWSILIISALGTFLSIFFGDEMMDVVSHKNRQHHHKFGLKYRIILVAGLAVLTITAYYFLLHGLHLEIPEVE